MADFADQINGRGHYAADAADSTPNCKNCALHRPMPIIGHPGRCAWGPPPALQRLYAALAAEPGTQIAYDKMFGDTPDALPKGACGAHKRKVQS